MASADAFQDTYFRSYGDLSVHELMLKDRSRTLTYRRFFEANGHLVKGKIVMDVGAGTGILSLFAASAGAKKVLAVEASGIASLCAEIVAENQLSHIIEVIHGPVETISLPDGIKSVDIIVSEWMGFYLLHESMLDSVIVARDRFLAPDGILVPSHASIFVAPVDMTDHFQDRSEEWSNIYGFDFSPVASQINMDEVSKPLITSLKPKVLCSDPQELSSFNLKTVTAENTRKICRVLQFSVKQDSKIFGFAVWFDAEFSWNSIYADSDSRSTDEPVVNERGDAHSCDNIWDGCKSSSCNVLVHDSSEHLVDHSNDVRVNGTQDCSAIGLSDCSTSSNVANEKLSSVALKTGPNDPVTHWKQTVLFLPRAILVEGGITLCCRMKLEQDSTNNRHYNIAVTLIDENDLGDEDSDEQDNDICDSDDSTDHPVPCLCGSHRCRLIAALVDNYEVEHRELAEEAELVELEAEVNAARQLGKDIENGGWQMDSHSSGESTHENMNGCVDDV